MKKQTPAPKKAAPIKKMAAPPAKAASTSMNRKINDARENIASKNAKRAGQEVVSRDAKYLYQGSVRDDKKAEFDSWNRVGNKAMSDKYESEKKRLGVKPTDRQRVIDERNAYIKKSKNTPTIKANIKKK